MAVTYTVVIELKPGAADEFLALLMPVLDAMRLEETFMEAALHRDAADSDRFLIYETWTDPRDVEQVQMGRAYRKEFWARLPALLRNPRQVSTWLPMRTDRAE